MKSKKKWLIILSFIILLTSFRLAWLFYYNDPDRPKAEDGVLDIRSADLMSEVMPVNGEWAFYPDKFVNPNQLSDEGDATPIRVPSDWRSVDQNEQESSFGHGTYHLRIITNPNDSNMYRLRFMGISTASRVYINGEEVGELGKVGANKATSEPNEMPFSVNAQPAAGKIDIVIQVSNFDHIKRGGIGRTIYFGGVNAVEAHEHFSMGLQLIGFAVLFFHGIYILVLYLFVFKQKKLLLFAGAVFSMAVSIIFDDDQLIRVIWPEIGFEERIKLTLLFYASAYILSVFYLKTLVKDQFNRTFKLFSAVSIFYIIAIVCLDYNEFNYILSPIYSILMLTPAVLIPLIFNKKISIKTPYSIYLVFTAIAISSSTFWGSIKGRVLEIGIPFYPFDLLIAVVCFALYWFKTFYHTSEERKELNEKLQRDDKRKDDFLVNTSHELRNPLHAMMNIAQSLLREPLPEDTKERVRMMESVARNMSHTLNDLTDLSTLREGKVHLTLQPVHLHGIVEYVFNLPKEGRPVELINDIPSSFPTVKADENRTIQIVFNLVQNALKFTEDGLIAVSAEEKDGKAIITIKDTGIGMDEELQKRIFQPYEQADSSITSSRGGLGLGLSICAQLVELHGGEIFVTSSPGVGSSFSFSLPISHEQGERQIIFNEGIPDIVQEHQDALESDVHVLLVDDDPVNLKVVSSILEKEGYSVKACLGAEEALQQLYSEKWSIVVSDVMMPKMSGYELTSRIRKVFSMLELPVLLLTARSRVEDIQAGFQAGANDYVKKPVEQAELLARVSSLIQLKTSLYKQTQTEAALLQAQIQPHFLFNTLNAIIALSEIDPDKMSTLLYEFGNYLQKSFDAGNLQDAIFIENELELVKSYLFIEQQRFGSRLSVHWNVDSECLHAKVPPLSIQTLVENAVRHGMSEHQPVLTVSISIVKKDDNVEVKIVDDGKGVHSHVLEKKLSNSNKGLGLTNTNKRLIHLSGKGLIIESVPGCGTTVTFNVAVPYKSLEEVTK
ncbi:ATP-binding protein [Lysinibacillus halotolerans]|uniref:histidine kinase n=1 Tax=Lysinibacillus halotolerans TaxID=1368476 RepID=A0A3M8H446_9BACI|nr:ATP-binding protein [Lysinibacillus halotolerans]RNC97236.1 response regulator [Lysinibacillus halotolerans]